MSYEILVAGTKLSFFSARMKQNGKLEHTGKKVFKLMLIKEIFITEEA